MGAELNAELAKQSSEGHVKQRGEKPEETPLADRAFRHAA
jgi:hypothetical protein